jgi:hemerythrin-like domain-containing protein
LLECGDGPIRGEINQVVGNEPGSRIVNALITELHQDHVNLGRLLNLLGRELDRLRRGENPNYWLLLDLVDYIESYPDQIHHPREDVIFDVYLESHQASAVDIRRLMDEHKSLIVLSHELRELIDQVTQSSVFPRDLIESRLSDYLNKQWEHLNLEEGEIFQLLSDSLTPEQWDKVNNRIPRAADPLFGGAIQQRYQAIYEQIMLGSSEIID